jgi:hypothetical protein
MKNRNDSSKRTSQNKGLCELRRLRPSRLRFTPADRNYLSDTVADMKLTMGVGVREFSFWDKGLMFLGEMRSTGKNSHCRDWND